MIGEQELKQVDSLEGGTDYSKNVAALARVLELVLILKRVSSGLGDLADAVTVDLAMTTFLQSMLIGFESEMSRLVVEAGADPIRLVSDPSRSPLQEIQHDIAQGIYHIDEHKERFKKAYQEAYALRMKEFSEEISGRKEADLDLMRDIQEGAKYITGELDQIEAINRRLMGGDQLELSKFLEPQLNSAVAAVSASASAFFVNIDSLGRFVGSELALLSKQLLGQSVSEKIGYGAKASLTMLFVYYELYEKVYGKGYKKAYDKYKTSSSMLSYIYDAIANGLFYPIVSGITVGMYEELEKENPEALSEIRKIIGEKPETKDKKGILEDIKECYKKAEKAYEEFDKKKDETEINKDLLEDFSSSERYLEGCRMISSFFNRHEYIKFCTLGLIAMPKIVQNLTSMAAFNTASIAAKLAYSPLSYAGSYIGSYFTAAPSPNLDPDADPTLKKDAGVVSDSEKPHKPQTAG